MTPSDLISVQQAAKRLGVDENTVYRWIASDSPPDWALRIGRRWKVSVPLLEATLGSQAQPPELTHEQVLAYLAEHPSTLLVAVTRALDAS